MKKLKVMTVVGTRPEIIRLSRVMARLDESPAIEHITVHTGQNYDYELNEIFYKDLEIRKPDYYLDAAGGSVAGTIGNVIARIDPILEKEKPDALLVLGDTNSCLCAIPAKRRHIPVFHMEAGNRCFDQRVPEELNRKIVDHIADINLPYSSIAREYLLREGIPPDRIIKTGSPMYEVLHCYMPKIKASKILETLELKPDSYFVVSAHREENIDNDKNFFDLIESLNLIAETWKLPIIFSTHPRTRKRIEQSGSQSHTVSDTESHSEEDKPCNTVYNTVKHCETKINPRIQFLKPLSFSDYVALQLSARAVLSDSGTISEEASILNLRALNIREAHERPEAMEEASVIMTGLKPANIMQGIMQLGCQKHGTERNLLEVTDYTVPNVSDKIVRLIISYTGYARRIVWGSET